MKELVKHIEYLLLDNDCVIIPQFGGFVTRHISSQYVEEEQLFLPPIRTVGFNLQLKEDDGLLVSSYMKAYQITEVEAKALISNQVSQLQQELLENGSCDMGSLGMLTTDENGLLKFSPCQAGTVCPAFYGLDALMFHPLPAANAENTATQDHKIQQKETNHNEITIRLNKTWLQNIAAIAAVVIMFLILSPSAQNTGMISNDKAEFANLMAMTPKMSSKQIPAEHSSNPLTSQAREKKVDKESNRESTSLSHKNINSTEIVNKNNAESTSETTSLEKQDEKIDNVKELKGYCIVVASAISEKNAHLFVKELHHKGYNEAQVYQKGRMTRVVFPGYSSEEEAYNALRTLSKRSDEFSSAWVYYIK